MNKYIMVTTTFDNIDEANIVIDILLKEKLVSCCQIVNIKSAYHWKGNIEKTDEFLVQMKTKKSLYKELENKIVELHSYETPQIIAYDITCGYDEYLNWIGNETK